MTMDNLLTQHIPDHHCVLVSRSLWPQLLQCDPVPNTGSIPERNSRTGNCSDPGSILSMEFPVHEWGWGMGTSATHGRMLEMLWRFKTEAKQLIFCVTHVFAVLPFARADRKNPHWLSRLQILLSYTGTVLQFCFLSFYLISSSL